MHETNFFWEPLSDNILQERDETGSAVAEYTSEPGLYGNLICQNRGGVESQYHFDAIGSTLAQTDDNQQVTDTYAYSAFGEVTEQSGSTTTPFQYIGEKEYYRDDLTDDCSVRQRPLSHRLGRWRSPDPLGVFWGINLYRVARNAPTKWHDPSSRISVLPLRDNLDSYTPCLDDSWIYWDFHLDRKAPCNGYIVQQIDWACGLIACPCEKTDIPDLSRTPVYWEAWRVTKNETLPDMRLPPLNRTYTDMTGSPAEVSCGYVSALGTIKFFCESKRDDPRYGDPAFPNLEETADLSKSWAPVSKRLDCGRTVTSGVVIGTTNKPKFFDGPPVEGPAVRSYERRWACCLFCGFDEGFDVSDASPKKSKWPKVR